MRLLDNSNALVFIRGEKPIIDKKFDILSHQNIKLTADGGAVPYTHSKKTKYFRWNLSVNYKEPEDGAVIDMNFINNNGIEFMDIPEESNEDSKND